MSEARPDAICLNDDAFTPVYARAFVCCVEVVCVASAIVRCCTHIQVHERFVDVLVCIQLKQQGQKRISLLLGAR